MTEPIVSDAARSAASVDIRKILGDVDDAKVADIPP